MTTEWLSSEGCGPREGILLGSGALLRGLLWRGWANVAILELSLLLPCCESAGRSQRAGDVRVDVGSDAFLGHVQNSCE